jgi:predicted dehydrogenase
MSKIRIGFVGVGNMGQAAHLANYVTVPDCQVVALAEVRPKLAKAVAARYGIAKVYPDAEAMLAAEELDGVVASQPFTKHAAIVPPLLRKGLTVLTEKPLAGTVDAGEKILAALRASGGKLYIAYNKRSDPAVMRAKQQIAQWQSTGEAGKLRYVRIAMPPGDWVANGFTHLLGTDDPYPAIADDPMPAGWDEATFQRNFIFVNFYIHQVNLLRHLLGEDYTVQFGDPSGVLFVAKSASGVCGTIEMAAFQSSIDWQEEAFIAFERGWIKIELRAPLASNQAGRVSIFSDKGDGAEPQTVIPTLPMVHSMRSQAMNFVKTLKGEASPMCEASEAIKDLYVARDYINLTT